MSPYEHAVWHLVCSGVSKRAAEAIVDSVGARALEEHAQGFSDAETSYRVIGRLLGMFPLSVIRAERQALATLAQFVDREDWA